MTTNCAFYFMKAISLQLILFLSFSSLAYPQDTSVTQVNQSLRSELLKMQNDDQKYRGEAHKIREMSLTADEKQKRVSALMEKQERLDKRNIKRLVQIIDKYGWPGRSLVGREASLTAFLIIQHADLEDQKKYFPMLKEAVRRGEANQDYAALLEDRILMREGKKQIYGSQLHFNEVTKQLELWAIEDEENVDARRASIGLEPLAEYVKRFGLEYKPLKKK
jgi:hypothetical protein